MNYFQIEIIGLVAAVFTTVSFIPQVLKISKKRSAKGVSVSMYVIMFLAVLWNFDQQYRCYCSEFNFGYITIGHHFFFVDSPQE